MFQTALMNSPAELRATKLATESEWTPEHQQVLDRLRREQNEETRLLVVFNKLIVPANWKEEIPGLQTGVPYPIYIFQNIGLCELFVDGVAYGLNVHLLLENFVPFVPFSTSMASRPFAQHLTLDEVLDAADRWEALSQQPMFQVHQPFGFDENDGEDVGTYRSAQFFCATKADHDGATPNIHRADSLSKLTEMVDIVRATEIENRLAERGDTTSEEQ